jgi:hypothetical protein
LRDRGRRHRGAPRELGADDVALIDRLQREVLRDGERRLVAAEQTLDPPADQRRRPRERLRRVAAAHVVARARH